MTIGRNNEAPAAYALTSTIKRLLEHLTQVDIYSAKDLDHITHTIKNLRKVVETTNSGYPPTLITLLSNRLDVCQGHVDNLVSRLDRLKGDLPKLHEKLISILRSLSLANTKSKVSFVGYPGYTEVLFKDSDANVSGCSFPLQKSKSFRNKPRRLTHIELMANLSMVLGQYLKATILFVS
jgi:hypothetical protein